MRQRFLSRLGPGLISGAANDDPSCISTFSVAGALFGYATLWTSLVCLPLLGAVQLMCARLAMVTGRGLAGGLRLHFPRWVLLSACIAVVAANVVNLGADLGGMAEATELLTGIPALWWTPVYTLLIMALLFRSPYRRIAGLFKWLTLTLFAYVAAGFLAAPDWPAALAATFLPGGPFSADYLSVLVGIFGAALSPYLLFWQASQVVEEESAKGRWTVEERRGATREEIEASRIDVSAGALVSRLIAYFMTLTTAATLHSHGQRHIETARQAAEALRPLAGDLAYLLFALGLIGTGMLAVPVLAGSCAYAVSEAAAWRGSLDRQPRVARRFYRVLAAAMLLGMGLKLLGFQAVSMLFWAAVLNGAIAPPLIALVTVLTSRRDLMGTHVNRRLIRWLGWAATAITGAAAAGMLMRLL